MRPRNKIEKDFNNAMPESRDEALGFQREKLLFEVLLDIRDTIEDFRGLIRRIETKGFELNLVLEDKNGKRKIEQKIGKIKQKKE